MAKKTLDLDTPFRKNEKVVVARDLPGIAEGTTGKIKLVNGVGSWMRYWVLLNDGTLSGQISHSDLARPAQLAQWAEREAQRALAATQSQEEAEAASTAAAADAGGATGAASLIPAHLLERSKAAKARLLGT